MDVTSTSQISALAWIVLAAVVAILAAVVAIVRSGRTVPFARMPRRRPR